MDEYEREQMIYCKEGPMVHGSFHPEFFYHKAMRNKIRAIYMKNKNIRLPYMISEGVHIVVHIRRGDVTAEKYPSRFISNEQYIELLNKIINTEQTKVTNNDLQKTFDHYEESDVESINSDEIFFNAVDKPIDNDESDDENIVLTVKPNNEVKITVHLFSEGDESDFKNIEEKVTGANIQYHLEETVQNAFHAMVEATVLIVSKSSFSYCAALMNENRVVANHIKNWWHKPLESWEII